MTRTGHAALRSAYDDTPATRTSPLIPTGTWTVDPAHSEVGFSVKHMGMGEPQRDEHLRSADFFNVGELTEITFESTRTEAIDDESSRVYGNLTMHGITHEIKLDVLIHGTDVDPWGNTRAGLDVEARRSMQSGVAHRSPQDAPSLF